MNGMDSRTSHPGMDSGLVQTERVVRMVEALLKGVPALNRHQLMRVSMAMGRLIRVIKPHGTRCAVNHPSTPPRFVVREQRRQGRTYMANECLECKRVRFKLREADECACLHTRNDHEDGGECYHEIRVGEYDCDCTQFVKAVKKP